MKKINLLILLTKTFFCLTVDITTFNKKKDVNVYKEIQILVENLLPNEDANLPSFTHKFGCPIYSKKLLNNNYEFVGKINCFITSDFKHCIIDFSTLNTICSPTVLKEIDYFIKNEIIQDLGIIELIILVPKYFKKIKELNENVLFELPHCYGLNVKIQN